jgi:cytochrome c oxidase assembly protein subunit 15
MFMLGGLQGFMGWYMVKSGLVDRPEVSQYRLTAHLALAFAVYAWMLWTALGLLYPQRGAVCAPGPRRLAHLALVSVAVTVLSGGFVAGLDAGLAYNTFPTMNGEWFPSAWASFQPWWRNLFENIAAVQFDHRLLALLTLGLILALHFKARSQTLVPRARLGITLLVAMAWLQVGLGIATLLLHVPIALASLHQAGALMLFTLALYCLHALKTQWPEA